MALYKTTVRKRDTLFPLGKGKRTYQFGSNPKVVTFQDLGTIKGTQITASEGHPFQSRKTRSTDDIGGDFTTSKTYVENRKGDHRMFFRNVGTNETFLYEGPIYPVIPGIMTFPPSAQSVDSALNTDGATAISRCKPTNSVADASVFLGELLREGVPQLIGHTLWKDKTSAARKASSEYLNAEFGWKPVLNDMQKFLYAVRHASTVMKQYERDAGKVVRRNYQFPIQRTTETTRSAIDNYPFFGPAVSGFFDGSGGGRYVRTRETVRRKWFSGAFTYQLPDGFDSRKEMDRYALMAEQVFGLTLTPEVIWNLAPWSWAVDWFSNTGDVFSNISDFASDGLVMRYGYIMEHSIVRDTYTLEKTGFKTQYPDRAAPITLVNETKVRRRANPFGFGVSWTGLSPRQLAIAAALGITRR